MPYKRVTPADTTEMRKMRYVGHHSICEKIREIWRSSEGNPEVRYKCREAIAMAKRMNEMLKKFKEYRESPEYKEEQEQE